MAIRNIVFDVGNVLVVWDPIAIEREAYGADAVDAPGYVSPLRGNEVWLALNRGELSFAQAKERYVAEGFAPDGIDRFFEFVLSTQALKRDTVMMMGELAASGYRLFAITDNVHEIVAYLKRTYDFWPCFEVAAVSADLGVLKPDPAIYRWLLDEADLEPSECVFMDDVPRNVAGAEASGMKAFTFTTAAKAREDLRSLGVDIAIAR